MTIIQENLSSVVDISDDGLFKIPMTLLLEEIFIKQYFQTTPTCFLRNSYFSPL